MTMGMEKYNLKILSHENKNMKNKIMLAIIELYHKYIIIILNLLSIHLC